METRIQTARNLADAIKRHSPAPMTDDEAAEGARNLTGFFELLIQIHSENQQQG
ncbi:MAG: hypothetical protein SFX19_06225 [Alphaproteobacteria bacterium]|nr:hypothetical protein [Alphaproteobacteria bacterium]